jgi:hypothetical protein
MSEQQQRNQTVAWVLLLVSLSTVSYIAGKQGWSVDPRTWVTPSVPAVVPAVKVTAATYVYEKDEGGMPPAVTAALSKLNEQGIVATVFERNTVNGAGQVPTQYVSPLAEASKSGLPALVVSAGSVVVKVVKAPKTEAEVMGAIR